MAIQAGETTFYQAKRGIVQDGLVLNLDAAVDASYSGGTTWRDLAGSNDGTMQNMNDTNLIKDNGGVFTFDGTDEYIDLGIITSGSTMSLSVWVNLDVNNIYQHIIDSSSNYWHFAMLNTGYLYFYNGSVFPGSQSQISTNTWHMLSLSFDLTNWHIYINGTLDSTINTATSALNHGNINIGRWQSGGRYLNGKISNLQIYNRVLTSDEIARNYNATRHRFGV